MEKGRFCRLLVASITLLAFFGIAHADAPKPEAQSAPTTKTQARKKKRTVKAPKVSLTCKSDEDCAFTKMADGDCCPSLCQPRVVSKTSAAALEKYATTCAKPGGGECPVPACMPPRTTVEPACVSGKCAGRAASTPGRE
jgi:hypothetical protein